MPNRRLKFADEEIVNETGRTLNQWFSELRNKGLQSLDNKGLKQHLRVAYALDRDWASCIANAFLKTTETPDIQNRGFDISVRKTYAQPVETLYHRTREWFERDQRAISPSSEHQRKIECQWATDGSNVNIRFQSKGAGKTQVIVLHERLESSMDAEVMRNFWRENLKNMSESF